MALLIVTMHTIALSRRQFKALLDTLSGPGAFRFLRFWIIFKVLEKTWM